MMNWKETLRPDLKKVVLTAVIFVLVTFAAYLLYGILMMDVVAFGFPLTFYARGTLPMPSYLGHDSGSIYYLNLVVDIAIWYVVTCVVMNNKKEQKPVLNVKKKK